MKQICLLFTIVVVFSCDQRRSNDVKFIQGRANETVTFLTLGQDTIWVADGVFNDSLNVNSSTYDYLKLDTWKWPKLIYLDRNNSLNIEFKEHEILVKNDPVNTFLLNKDSILIPYSAKWNMEEEVFNKAWEKESPINMARIDDFFKTTKVSASQIAELKQIELMIRGHLTTNFVSYQERNGVEIDRKIYDFVKEIDLDNERLAKQVNNRNFQYFYTLDKMDAGIPDSIYPFRAIDTISHYVKVKSIRDMIIKGVVKSSLFSDQVDHDQLFNVYEQHIGKIKEDDKILGLYQKIQKLRPGNPAPEIGELKSSDGKVFTLDQFKGQNILITVWGSWCPFCKEELPHIKALMNKYGNSFTSVGISFDQEEAKWKEYIESNDWQGIHLIDSEKGSTFKTNYLAKGTNKFYLIDKNGKFLMSSKYKPSSTALEELIRGLKPLPSSPK